MEIISIILTIVFITVLSIYLLISYKRDTLKHIWSLITNIVIFIESFLVTRLLVNILGTKVSALFSSFIKTMLNIKEEEWLKNSSIDGFTNFLAIIMIGVGCFFLVFLVIYVLNHGIKRIIFKVIKNEKYSKYVSNFNNKIVNLLVGLGSFAIISFALLYPLGTMMHIVDKAAQEANYSLPKYVTVAINNPISKIYSNNLSVAFFNGITKLQNDSNNIQNSLELKGMSVMILSFLNISEGGDAPSNIESIKMELSNTSLVPNFISELCSNAATRWKDNQSFMGVSISLPTDQSRDLYIALLDIISNWERDNLINDINTIFELYQIFNDNDILITDNDDALVEAIANDEFTEDVFLCLFHNDDFKMALVTFMNYGINVIFEEININTNNTQYININNLNDMTDEDIKKEAYIFSLTVRQIMEINSLKGQQLTLNDYNRIINNLNEILNSRLLNNVLYNVIYNSIQSYV